MSDTKRSNIMCLASAKTRTRRGKSGGVTAGVTFEGRDRSTWPVASALKFVRQYCRSPPGFNLDFASGYRIPHGIFVSRGAASCRSFSIRKSRSPSRTQFVRARMMGMITSGFLALMSSTHLASVATLASSNRFSSCIWRIAWRFSIKALMPLGPRKCTTAYTPATTVSMTSSV